ncbi:MAG: ACP S-malonyltransferase [Propionibacteriaceae bacterium]|nr:ACP S-malonyltransferase [Propionibacteriaceae bacterium]
MGGVALVFAGQGAQTPGMGSELYESSPAARAIFDEAETLRPGIKELCFLGPASELNLTVNTQPCLFVVDYACAVALEEAMGEKLCGTHVTGAAGFSLGEVVASSFTGIMDFRTGFDFVCARGEAMNRAGQDHPGVMYAVVKLDSTEVEEIADSMVGVYPVNYNSPTQTVVACEAAQGDQFVSAVANRGGKALKLRVSGGFHSPLMESATAELAELTQVMSFTQPTIPLYSAMTTRPYDNPRELLPSQVNSPVLWAQTIEAMATDGFDTFIEVGPGRTLSNFINQIDDTLTTWQASDAESVNQVATQLMNRKGN